MSNQLSAMLRAWQEGKTDTEWVLGTVYRTEGSAYRKAGAMMLINGHGQQFGLLSGGCLEADIIRNARRAMVTGKTVMLVYDGNDEDDLSFRLGVGCGGKVFIMLQPLDPANDLGLSDLCDALAVRQSGLYFQKIGEVRGYFKRADHTSQRTAYVENRPDGDWLVTPIVPEPHILIVGGGLDARPVVSIAHEMGWKTTLVDPRPANARPEHFPTADTILRQMDTTMVDYVAQHRVDAAILMSHSIDIDAKALLILKSSPLRHVSMLGPRHRFADVLERADLAEPALPFPVASPAGIDIGGQLPESIALSMLSGIHAALYKHCAAPALAQAAE